MSIEENGKEKSQVIIFFLNTPHLRTVLGGVCTVDERLPGYQKFFDPILPFKGG